ncbi:nuclear transport factor 2 family protein [Chryseolinea sp. T2]|uniref:nuclear transport factor 2 family protein n=1 Tax=Chryseolinea sp. T2 TaxID=3129255 RepID=UPI0030772531
MTKELILTSAACARSVAYRPFFVALAIALQLICLRPDCLAQSSEEQQVRSVVAQLFKGMELGDSAMARKSFMPQVTVATVKTTKEGQLVLTRDAGVAGFLKAIGTPHPDKWYEEIWNVKVSIDGLLAQVWCDYAFYLGNKFSHCGVDAFQLFKDGGTWKIFHLADTRRSTECNIPADIVKKHAQ